MRAAKVDANQPAIVEALRKAGCFVQPLHMVGDGVPDLLVGGWGKTALIEVKDGSLSPSRRTLTPDQQQWHARWTGGTLAIVPDVEAALRIVALLKGQG